MKIYNLLWDICNRLEENQEKNNFFLDYDSAVSYVRGVANKLHFDKIDSDIPDIDLDEIGKNYKE